MRGEDVENLFVSRGFAHEIVENEDVRFVVRSSFREEGVEALFWDAFMEDDSLSL